MAEQKKYINAMESMNVLIWRFKWRLLGVFVLVFFITLSLLLALKIVPESIAVPAQDSNLASVTSSIETSEEQKTLQPERIIIDTIGVDANVVNPQSRDIDVLDKALKDGVVHFPGSGNLDDESNMFLFGHSSFLPVVYNRNYQVFNNLDKLKQSDVIRVYSGGREYRYEVASVRLDDAAAISVPLTRGEKKLTLSTCNSFGASSERFVVEADFVGSYPLTS